MTDFMFAVKPWEWTLEERMRVEYREIENQDAFFRFRNRMRLRPPWKWTGAEIQPWTAWEGYYENNPDMDESDRLNRHRFFVGLGAIPLPKIKTGCYYYWEQVLTNEVWESNNEIGLETSFVF